MLPTRQASLQPAILLRRRLSLLSSVPEDGLPFSDDMVDPNDASTLGFGVFTRLVAEGAVRFVAVVVVAVLVVVPDFAVAAVPAAAAAPVSPDFERMNDPGSPASGFSSMYSSPYRPSRLNASARFLVSWYVELVLLTCAPTIGGLPCEMSASGNGVVSLLGWAEGPPCVVSEVRGTGGMYVCPYEGVKVGNDEAVLSSLVREVTAES